MASFVASVGVAEGAGMTRELGVSELRYRAVLEVLDGARVTEVARRFGGPSDGSRWPSLSSRGARRGRMP